MKTARLDQLLRRWLARRNAALASPAFQRWAAALPGTRWIARRRAAGLFDLVAGFAYSQILLAVVQADLLRLLAGPGADTARVAAATGLSTDAALRLLRAAAALDLVQAAGADWWMQGQQGAALSSNAGAQAMIRHHMLLYADLADPLALLRADRAAPTRLSAFWGYAGTDDPARTAGSTPYSALMAASQAMVAQQALAAYDFGRHARLMDVGGGHGAFVDAVAARHPGLAATIFDLPDVVAAANARYASADFGSPPALIGGDFFAGALPGDHDCISLVRILHDHDDAPAQQLLAAIHAALPPGGRLVIAEPMAATRGARAMGDGYFGMYLWAMRSGRPRSAREIGAMLRRAGFARWREYRTPQPLIARVIVAAR